MVIPKSPYSYANQISMSKSSYKGTYFLVEGYADLKLFKKFIDENNCRVKFIPGKTLAIDVLKILEKRNESGVLLLVDADYDHLEGIKPMSVNMFYTDNHDIETMIISTNALENLLNEFSDKRKLTKFEKFKSNHLRSVLLTTCISIGYVRWASIHNNWTLKFRDLVFSVFIDFKNLNLHYQKFLSELIKNSRSNKIPLSVIIKEVKLLTTKSSDPWMICSGHDLTEILLISLKFIFGYNVATLTREKLEAILRLAYEFRFFKKTILYSELKRWEKNNPLFSIFN